MSGLMRRLTRGRAATDDEATPQASAASEPVSATPDAQQGGASVPPNGVATPPGGDDDAKTAVLAQASGPVATPEADRDLPAGVDAATLATAPSTAKRGRLRRRLRYLRAAREILLRDIGGFYYEAQRSDAGLDPHRRLLDAKTARLTRLDEEMRDLESRLGEAHPETILRQPGLGGTCPQCGELHGSDARFCPRCGTPLTGRGSRIRPARSVPSVAATSSGEGTKATTASLWGRPKRPEPVPAADATQADAPDAAEEKSDGGRPSPPPPAAREPDEPAAREPDEPAAREPDEPAPTGSERS
jgi:hypothetical protein